MTNHLPLPAHSIDAIRTIRALTDVALPYDLHNNRSGKLGLKDTKDFVDAIMNLGVERYKDQQKRDAAEQKTAHHPQCNDVTVLALRLARYDAIARFEPVEQYAVGTHRSVYYWPRDAREERGFHDVEFNNFNGAKMRDRVLAALLLSAMAATGDI